MPSPREFYKSAHPDYFSDSEVKEVSQLDRTLLEFHLDTLTSRSQEADFEHFARRLCEKTICPNLLPTTGPTGGGDSKADSETFPVADSLALKWHGGFPREASEERWAFAFSAKAEWSSKVKSDIKKISETERGYTKAFFVSNQNVPARRRAATEDSLRSEYGIDVRILDRNWILDNLFSGRHELIAIEELKITGLTKRDSQPGPIDSTRITQLNELELAITKALETNSFVPSLVDDAIEVANICRSLEKPRIEVEGSYIRADRLAMKYGTQRQQVESIYQWAWTLFWWYEDIDSVISKYNILEQRAVGSENIYNIERMSNLYTVIGINILNSEDEILGGWMDERTKILRAELERLKTDENRPSTSLQATSLLLTNELINLRWKNEDFDHIFIELKVVIERANGLVGFPLESLLKLVGAIGDSVEDSDSYTALFETIVEASSKRNGEIQAARMLLARGEHLMKQDKPAKAIAYVGQALGRLYKHETRKEIVYALYLCGIAYERIGLLWAARGAYLSGAGIAANDFWSYEQISKGFALCVTRMKWIELKLGRIPHLMAWHELDTAISSKRSETGTVTREEVDENFDILVARSFLRMKSDNYSELGGIVDALDNLGLHISASILLFLLGHLDKVGHLADKTEKDPEAIIETIWNIKTDTPLLHSPSLCDTEEILLKTSILGCDITAYCWNQLCCVGAGESILASLESLLSTSPHAFAFEPELTIEVIPGEDIPKYIQIDEEEVLGRCHFVVNCKVFDLNNISAQEQNQLRDEIFEASLNIFPHIGQFRDLERDIETLFKKERVMERAAAFTGTLGNIRNVLGNFPKFEISQWVYPENTIYEMKRTEIWKPKSQDQTTTETKQKPQMGTGEAPPDLIDFDNLPHSQMKLISPIRQRLWNRAGWYGAFYMGYEHEEAPPPIFGLMFKDRNAGLEIFSAWLSEIGRIDEDRVIRITIVRGIDMHNPYAYRIIIGGNSENKSDEKNMMMILQRIHRMDATTPQNLDIFLKMYEKHKKFWLTPAFMGKDAPIPETDLGIGIYELNIRNAWEIGLNDLDISGIVDDDEIIIPDGVTNPPCLELQRWKRKLGTEA